MHYRTMIRTLSRLLLICAVFGLTACGHKSSAGDDLDGGGSNTNDASTVGPCQDFDQDGYEGGCATGDDCDDYNGDVHPGAPELCGDGIDNNCDGEIDEDCSCDEGSSRLCSSFFDPLSMTFDMHCRPGWQLCVDGIWDNECVGEVGPVQETCNGIDDNCDGEVDEGLRNAIGECSGNIPAEDCGPTGEGNGIDDNGDGQVDEGCSCAVPGYDPNLPRTGQPCYSGPIYTLGVGICAGGTRDCLPSGTWGPCVGETLPGTEICGDALDNDCDGWVDEGCPWCTIPGAEVCDGVDNDCDGVVDEDTLNICGSCGPVDDFETCGDGLDNNCNGQIDEGCPECEANQPCFPGAPDKAGVGACDYGTRSCNGEFWSECTGYVLPSVEQCGPTGLGNGVDEDCDGLVDEGCICPEGATRYCGDGAGACAYGTQRCHENVWSECTGGVGPTTEVCDGIDNDCDGLVDEGVLNACGTCGESCYLLPMDPTTDGTPDEGIEVIGAGDPNNPTGKDGITLTTASYIPPYLWAANHTNNTVTKFNTNTYTEEGIFWVGTNPSRTAVDLDGNMWVGGRDDGRLTKVLWDSSSCPENNNGTPGIQTSLGGTVPINSAGNIFADDCVAYSAVPQPTHTPNPSIRGIAAGPDGRVWIGYSFGGIQSIDPVTLQLGTYHGGVANVPRYEPDPTTGVQTPTGTLEVNNTVYGMVVDSQGYLYIAPYSDRTSFTVFDTNTNTWLGRFHGLCGSYGVALDGNDRVWFGSYTGCHGVNMFDMAEMKIHAFTIPAGTTAVPHGTVTPTVLSGNCKAQQPTSGTDYTFQTTGVGVEPATGDVWASHWTQGYTMRLRVDNLDYASSIITFIGTLRETAAPYNLLAGVGSTDLRGVGFDMNGNAWSLGLNSDRVWMIDPLTNARHTDIPNGQSIGVGSHYTYSDFTGSTALSFTAPRGFWTYIFSSQFEQAQVDSVVWDAYVPPETSAGVRIRALDDQGLPASTWLPADIGGVAQYFDYPAGAATNTIDLHANGGPLIGWSFEVNIRLTTTDRDIRPIVHDVRLEWQRP